MCSLFLSPVATRHHWGNKLIPVPVPSILTGNPIADPTPAWSRVLGLSQTTCRIVLTRKHTEIKKKTASWAVGVWAPRAYGDKSSSSWNQHQTLTDCPCCHIYCQLLELPTQFLMGSPSTLRRKVAGQIWFRFAAEALRLSVAKSSRPPQAMGKCKVKSTIISRFESLGYLPPKFYNLHPDVDDRNWGTLTSTKYLNVCELVRWTKFLFATFPLVSSFEPGTLAKARTQTDI